jgi:pyridoxamine 5'-phosphate oxidase
MMATTSLPEPLPADPLSIAADWLAEGIRRGAQPNPNAMVLATADASGRPSARVVLCKEIDARAGCLRFYTNYRSRKGRELETNPRAAVVLHQDHLNRQLRIEGLVSKAGAADSDRYFASRPRDSQLGAHASQQSQAVASHAALQAQFDAAVNRFTGQEVPRPSHWGGYELWADAVELWVQGPARLHDRALWTRELHPGAGAPAAGPWTAVRLQP